MLSLSEHAAVRAGPRQQQADVEVSSRQPPALKPAGNRCGKWFWAEPITATDRDGMVARVAPSLRPPGGLATSQHTPKG